MSHAWGCVQLVPNGEIVGWYEYNGTSDVACTAIFPTREALWSAWRTEDALFRQCSGEGPHVEVPARLWSDYGNGFGWPSRACLTCGVIVGHRSEEDADDAGARLSPEVAGRCDAALACFLERARAEGARTP